MIAFAKKSKSMIFSIFMPICLVGFLSSCGSDDDDEDTATATSLAFIAFHT